MNKGKIVLFCGVMAIAIWTVTYYEFGPRIGAWLLVKETAKVSRSVEFIDILIHAKQPNKTEQIGGKTIETWQIKVTGKSWNNVEWSKGSFEITLINRKELRILHVSPAQPTTGVPATVRVMHDYDLDGRLDLARCSDGASTYHCGPFLPFEPSKSNNELRRIWQFEFDTALMGMGAYLLGRS